MITFANRAASLWKGNCVFTAVEMLAVNKGANCSPWVDYFIRFRKNPKICNDFTGRIHTNTMWESLIGFV